MTTGDADFGVTGLTAGFYNLAGKGALRIVAAQSADVPGFHLSAYLATPKAADAGLKALSDFPGRSLGITQTGSTFHYMIGLLARKEGFDLARVRLVPLQSIPNMVSAFKGGQVDALILPSSVALPMIASGEGRLRDPGALQGFLATQRHLGAELPLQHLDEQRRVRRRVIDDQDRGSGAGVLGLHGVVRAGPGSPRCPARLSRGSTPPAGAPRPAPRRAAAPCPPAGPRRSCPH